MRSQRARLVGIGCILSRQLLCSAKIAPLSVTRGSKPTVVSNPLTYSPLNKIHSTYNGSIFLRDGNDGPWSTFAIRVGTPEQSVRVVPSTAGQASWVVLPGGCPPSDSPPDCSSTRGGIFTPNQSSTWVEAGKYELGVALNLNYSNWENGDYGHYGYDRLSFGWPGSGEPILDHQVIAGIDNRSQWYLGVLGLSPQSVNLTDYYNPRPSLLSTLRNTSLIPSLSYGYTAGAPYRNKGVLASLTLGGYDKSRFVPNAIKFNFAHQDERDLGVAIRAVDIVTTSGTHSALNEPALAYIDTTVPHIWLPLHACEAFEAAFGLAWDSTTQLYLVNDTHHEALLSQNASVTFELGDTPTGGGTTVIRLPYSSFDLSVSWPIVQNKTRYFPLKRATNDTQVTLGRTFFQEAYLTVDYERHSFSVSQADFVPGAQQNLVAIEPPGSSSGLPPGAIAGIVVGVILLVAFALFLFIRRRRREQNKRHAKDQAQLLATQPQPQPETVQLDGKQIVEIEGQQLAAEADGNPIHETHCTIETIEIHELHGVDSSSRHNEYR